MRWGWLFLNFQLHLYLILLKNKMTHIYSYLAKSCLLLQRSWPYLYKSTMAIYYKEKFSVEVCEMRNPIIFLKWYCCLKYVWLKKWEYLKVIKKSFKSCFTILFIRQIRSKPLDSAPTAALGFQLSLHQKRMTLQNFVQNKECDVR